MYTTRAFKDEEGRKWLRDMLHTNSDVEVTFTKVDGTERVMRCTLVESLITPYEKKTERVREPNSEVLRVWDLEKQEWRGFRYDAIKKIAFDLSNEE